MTNEKYNSQGEKLDHKESKRISEIQRKYFYKKKFEEMGFNFKKFSKEAQEHLLSEIISLYEMLEDKSFIDNNLKKIFYISEHKYWEFIEESYYYSGKEIKKKLEELLSKDVETKSKKIKKLVEDPNEILKLKALLECIYRSIIRTMIHNKVYNKEEEIINTNEILKKIISSHREIKDKYFQVISKTTIERNDFNCKEFTEISDILNNGLKKFEETNNMLIHGFKNFKEVFKSTEYSLMIEVESLIFCLDLILFYIIINFYNIYFNNSTFEKKKEDIYKLFLKRIEEYKDELKNNIRKPIPDEYITFNLIFFIKLKTLYNKYNLKYELFNEWNKIFENLSTEEKEKIKNTKISSEKIEILKLKYSDFKTGKLKDNHHKEKMEKLNFLFENLKNNFFIFNFPQNKEFIRIVYYLIYENPVKINPKKRTASINTILNNQIKNTFEKLDNDGYNKEAEYIKYFMLVLLQKIKEKDNETYFFINTLKELLNIIKIFIENNEYFSMNNLINLSTILEEIFEK